MKSIRDETGTRLKGIENFISMGIMSGELDVQMTIGDLLSIVKNIQQVRHSKVDKRMKGLVDDYGYR